VSVLLVLLNVGVCVAQTDVCPPPGSTMTGKIGQSGGRVVIVPSQPMKALGAEFRAGANVNVTVSPWHSTSGKRGTIVHVTGELAKESVIGGVRVDGTVTIGQGQGGRTTKPQLVAATDIKGGRLAFGTGTIELAPGMRLTGRVDLDRGRLEVTSDKPLRALGIDFDAGTVRLEERGAEVVISGTLARPQEIGGVLVTKLVHVRLGGKFPVFDNATLARATPLQALGLPDGEAPPGTIVQTAPAPTLVGPGPFTVCGIALAPPANQPTSGLTPSLTFQPESASTVSVHGTLVGADVDVGGMFLSGAVTLRFAAGSCKRVGVAGILSRPSTQLGVELAAQLPFAIGERNGTRFVRGTLVKPATVDGLPVTGSIGVEEVAGRLAVMDATLAKPAAFEAWELPAGTKLQRFTGGWQFETAKGQAARATGTYLGTQLDAVRLARRDDSATMLTFARPQPVHGVALTFVNVEHASGCLEGGVDTTQLHGIFEIPKEGSAMFCRGALVKARGAYPVQSLKVERWFATHAIAGEPGTPPVDDDAAAPAQKSAGFWIQINSLCRGSAGIPLPPPPQRWIFVDAKGKPANRADLAELTKHATKPGKRCPMPDPRVP
jgi:hypothetical protein